MIISGCYSFAGSVCDHPHSGQSQLRWRTDSLRLSASRTDAPHELHLLFIVPSGLRAVSELLYLLREILRLLLHRAFGRVVLAVIDEVAGVSIIEADPAVVVGAVGDAAPHLYFGVDNLVVLRVVVARPSDRFNVLGAAYVPAPVSHVGLDDLAVQPDVFELFTRHRHHLRKRRAAGHRQRGA